MQSAKLSSGQAEVGEYFTFLKREAEENLPGNEPKPVQSAISHLFEPDSPNSLSFAYTLSTHNLLRRAHPPFPWSIHSNYFQPSSPSHELCWRPSTKRHTHSSVHLGLKLNKLMMPIHPYHTTAPPFPPHSSSIHTYSNCLQNLKAKLHDKVTRIKKK